MSGRDNVVPFRRRRPLRPWREHLAIRLLRPFLSAVALLGAPGVVVLWLFTSPRFVLAEIAVETDDRVPASWVENQLLEDRGSNLFLLSLRAIEERIGRHPWVRGVDLRKQLPSGLTVRVEERRAVALARQEGDLVYLDEAGRAIAPFAAGRDRESFWLASRQRQEVAWGTAIALAREIAAVRPAWAETLSEIEILGDSDFRIHLAGLPFPLLVRTGTLESKIRSFEALLPRIRAAYGPVAAVDLRFAGRIVVQPSAPAAVRQRTRET